MTRRTGGSPPHTEGHSPVGDHGRIGLALSGGGYRACLFHIGSLWRLNELGWLPSLDEITSVSGGSIVSGYLGLVWKDLEFDRHNVATNLEQKVVRPLRNMCGIPIDVGAIAGGALNPFGSIGGRLDAKLLLDQALDVLDGYAPKAVINDLARPAGRVLVGGLDVAARLLDLNPFPSPSDNLVRAYERHLFKRATVQALPDPKEPDNPRITIYVTNMQTGVGVRIARDYMADYRLGKIDKPDILLARAVAASSAFPPFFTPVEMKFTPSQWSQWPDQPAELHDRPELLRSMDLADGAVYDNLGLERLQRRCDTVLVSDAGAPLDTLSSLPFDWLRQTLRTTYIFMDQARKLRKRMFIAGLKLGTLLDNGKLDGEAHAKSLRGTYWAIDTKVANYELETQGQQPPLIPDSQKTAKLAKIRTRLDQFGPDEQKALINWGYSLTDAAMRRWVVPSADRGKLPYADSSHES